MRLFRSKHQKLILQCYPPGKAVDKKPNPSELSYLLYYASTRRIKLEKVIEFLKAKTAADARGHRSGNLLVTLALISALIEKCYDNLNVFAPQVCAILASISSLKELPLCKVVVATYGTLCTKLDNGLFAGDKSFVSSFSKLTHDMIALGQAQSLVSSTNQREWTMTALLTCRHASNCLGYNAQLSQKFVPVAVALLAPTIAKSYDRDMLAGRLRASLNMERNDRALSTVSTVKSAAVKEQVAEHFDDDSLTDPDLAEEAFLGIRSLFHTTLAGQISQATRSVVEHQLEHTSDTQLSSWGTVFLENCASYIPVQLRFATLMTLLDVLSTLSNKFEHEKNAFRHIKHYSIYILDLVSSGFNIIGLSISDVLLQLLALQTNLHLKLADSLTASETTELSDIYSQCICNLSSHIYYFDQVSDSIEGIIFQIDSVLVVCRENTCSKVYTLILQLLEMISVIIDSVSESTSSRNPASLENWQVSLQFLTFKESYPTFFAHASTEQVFGLQKKYLEVFQHFLTTEMTPPGKTSETTDAADMTIKFDVPNYANYLEEAENPISRLLAHAERYFDDGVYDPTLATSLCYILECVSKIYGVNFGKNFLPFFDKWQLKQPTTSPAHLFRDKCAYLLLTSSMCTINNEYQDILQGDITKSGLSVAIQEDIEQRTSSGFWVPGDGKQDDETIRNQVSSHAIESFFNGTQFNDWFHTARTENGASATEDANGSADNSPSRANGFGLGSANDISSIYSGLLNGNGKHHDADASRGNETFVSSALGESHSYAYHMLPRVEDLKLSVRGALSSRGDQFSFSNESRSTSMSVLQKQIHTTDVESILADLTIDDDAPIVAR